MHQNDIAGFFKRQGAQALILAFGLANIPAVCYNPAPNDRILQKAMTEKSKRRKTDREAGSVTDIG
jgi:hypothetical protein